MSTTLITPVAGPGPDREPPSAARAGLPRGARLGILDNSKNNADLLLAELARLLEHRYDATTVVVRRKLHAGMPATEEELAGLDGCDVVLTGTADCGSCSSWTVRDAGALTRRGPDVWVVGTTEFTPLVGPLADRLGVPRNRLLMVAHPISALRPDAVHDRVLAALDLLERAPAQAAARARPAEVPDEVTGPDDLNEVQELFHANGWTDGLPIIPPTPRRVAAMLRHAGADPEHSLGPMPQLGTPATLRKIAVNAVLAGCRPEYLPTLVAAVRAVLDPAFNLYGVQPTTHPAGPLLVVNGPVVNRIGLNAGAGTFGPGARANATIGRALRLILINLGGARPGSTDKATHGQPGKYSACIAENAAANPWGPFHVDRGLQAHESAVTAVPAEAPRNINDHASRTAEGLLGSIVGNMGQVGTNNFWHDADVLLVLGPEHARTLADDGLSKADVQRHVAENTHTMMSQWSDDQQTTRFRKLWPALYGAADATTTRIPLVRSPERVNVVVAGGPGKHSMFVPTIGIGLSTTVRIDDD